MAAYLAAHRARTPARSPPVPERLLLRDTIYIFQGINGQFVRFAAPPKPPLPRPRRPYKRGEIVMDDAEPEPVEIEEGIEFVLEGSGYSISAPTRVLLHTLAELGWLYRKIDGAINLDREASDRKVRTVGMVEQSLHAALKSEMTEYYRLVAILEGQLDEGAGAEDPASGGVEGMEGGLTLMRLLVWTEDMRLRMRMMGTLVGEVGGAFPSFATSLPCTDLRVRSRHREERRRRAAHFAALPHVERRPVHLRLQLTTAHDAVRPILRNARGVDLRGRAARPVRRVLRRAQPRSRGRRA